MTWRMFQCAADLQSAVGVTGSLEFCRLPVDRLLILVRSQTKRTPLPAAFALVGGKLNYFSLASVAFTASKLGRSFGVGVRSLYCTTPC